MESRSPEIAPCQSRDPVGAQWGVAVKPSCVQACGQPTSWSWIPTAFPTHPTELCCAWHSTPALGMQRHPPFASQPLQLPALHPSPVNQAVPPPPWQAVAFPHLSRCIHTPPQLPHGELLRKPLPSLPSHMDCAHGPALTDPASLPALPAPAFLDLQKLFNETVKSPSCGN